MKKSVERQVVIMVVVAIFVVLFISSFASAGFIDWFNKITGRASSQSVTLNITVGNSAPLIYAVNATQIPSPLENSFRMVSINFSVNDSDGANNLVDATSMVNVSRGSQTRANYSCNEIASSGNQANYSCFVDMWYFDENGEWNITVAINDTSTQSQNNSNKTNFQTLTAFVLGPSALTFASLSPSAVNSTSNNDPLLLNNTGNVIIANGSIQVNSTDLVGETDGNKALYARNFSFGSISGVECNGINSTLMNKSVFQYVELANLSRGNHSVNTGATGQEQMYLCLRLVGSEISSQAYSTTAQGAWTVKIA